MFYIIYKTTNLVNGKFYIGKHKTKDLNDVYLGSGKLLKRAIKKYGIDNFHKEILHICKDEEHMNLLESILVVPDDETNYNLCEGGKGGWSYVNRTGRNFVSREQKVQAGRIGGNALAQKLSSDNEFRKQYAESKRQQLILHPLRDGFKGKKHREESKQKMRRSKNVGTNNSQFGTCWITNDECNKKISLHDLDRWLELGFRRGRITP